MADDPNSPLYPLYLDMRLNNELLAIELDLDNPRPHKVKKYRERLAALNDEMYEYKRAHSLSRRMEEGAKQVARIAASATEVALTSAVVVSTLIASSALQAYYS